MKPVGSSNLRSYNFFFQNVLQFVLFKFSVYFLQKRVQARTSSYQALIFGCTKIAVIVVISK